MNEEFIDVYNDKKQHIGSVSKKEAHEKGLWHKLFHCWIRGKNGKVWLQLRSSNLKTYPNTLTASVIGHIGAGESSVIGGKREIKEELNIDISKNKLQRIFEETHVIPVGNKQPHRHINDVYITSVNKSIDNVDMKRNEVDGIFEANIYELNKLFNGKCEKISINGYIFDENGKKIPNKRETSLNDFCPFTSHYYQFSMSAMINNDLKQIYTAKSITSRTRE